MLGSHSSEGGSALAAALNTSLEVLQSGGLRRSLRTLDSPQSTHVVVEGKSLINFSSNDYLSLANTDSLKAALVEAIGKWGVGSGASRLVCGSQAPHRDLEERLAVFKQTEAALTFTSGYAAAVGTLTALLDKNDVVLLDKLSHASLIDGARLSGATMRVFGHNDLEKLESLLKWTRKRFPADTRVLIVTESVFSMDGDQCPLQDLVRLKNAYNGLLLIDEAHALGVIGPGGRGLAAEHGLSAEVDFHLGTLSKAVGVSGGYLASSRTVINYLINRARSFIYSTAPSPALAAAAHHSLEMIAGDEGDRRRERLWKNLALLAQSLKRPLPGSAIVPYHIGSEELAMEAAANLREEGFWVPAIRYPTVARSKARLRITLCAQHSEQEILNLAHALNPARDGFDAHG